ncbi:MAG: alpha-amylase [Paludibacteraceae bacterium]|nr:alpha-amylase [Paludibacteraceae bacterium]
MSNIYKAAFLALMGMAATSCTKSGIEAQTPATEKPEWTRNAVIYEVNWRQFTDDGKVTSFANHLPYLKELGADILWFMPIHPISEVNRKGELGSYYSVQDYKAVNPELGTLEEFKDMVKQAHGLGMKVIIDWVANHTGCDNVWLAEHPDWYAYDENGNLIQPWDWTDTYKLNYDNPDMRTAMTDAMKFWVKECDIDGFRCDVAFMVPMDFWLDVRAELEKIKPVFMLAEASESWLLDGAFDMLYNWPAGFLFERIYKGEKSIATLDTIVHTQLDTLAVDSYQMNHITNHDRNTWDGTEFERLGDGVKAFAALTYIMPGMPLIYTGQEVGYDHRYEFFKKDTPATLEKNEWWQFYNKLNTLKHERKSLRAGIEGGIWKTYSTSKPESVLACSRVLGDEETLLIGNFSSEPVSFLYDYVPQGKYKNYLTGEDFTFTSGEEQTLGPWEFIILVDN